MIDLTVEPPLSGQPFEYIWPSAQRESYDAAWETTAHSDGRTFKVRHGLCYREAFGKSRRHSTTFVDGYPTVEASGVDAYDTTHELASFIRTAGGRRVVNSTDIPSDYRGLHVVRHSDVISGPRKYSALAVMLPEDAVADWARIAVARKATAPVTTAAHGRVTGDWEQFIHWAAKWYASPGFEANERLYKIQIAERLRQAKAELAVKNSKWLEALRQAFGPPNNLTNWQMHDGFLRWLGRVGEAATSVVDAIWDPEDPDRLTHFLVQVPKDVVSGAGSRLSLASFLQLAINETDLPFYKPTAVQKAYLLAGFTDSPQPSTDAQRYSDYLEFIDSFIEEGADSGLALRDRLDAQGLAWSVSSLPPPDSWSVAEQEEYTAWRDAILRDARDRAGDLARLKQLLAELDASRSRLWLVAQGSNYAAERKAGVLRSPKKGKDGRTVTHWSAMTQVQAGDVILHYARGAFRAVGVAQSVAEDLPGDNELGPEGGWLVRVAYHDLESPVARDAIPRDLRTVETAFTNDGGVQQGYLFKIGEKLAEFLIGDVQPPASSETAKTPLSLEELEATTLWSRDALLDLVGALTGDVHQVVLAGPPGTGKSFVAQKVVAYLAKGDATRWKIVQFHPSYSYEQFVEGLRPVVRDGAVNFDVVPGVVLEFASAIPPGGPDRYLIIDEMNRANLARVFGELMLLFEYRGLVIDLAYRRRFSLTEHLRFIGTMNTADRSIRSIDTALRRRFEVYECLPDAGILERYYGRRTNGVTDLITGFQALNDRLAQEFKDNYHGIGHTFFMNETMTPDKLERIWKRQIYPLLQEYFFDRVDALDEYALNEFWPSIG